MVRRTPQSDVVRALFAKSGNRCAFPGCGHPLIDEKNQFVAQVCHIEAAEEGGERYSPDSDDEYRRSFENLMLLCYRHHVETNNVDEYPVSDMQLMKAEHERQFSESEYKISEAVVRAVVSDMEIFWAEIDYLNSVKHQMRDVGLAIDIDTSLTFSQLITGVAEALYRLEKLMEICAESDQKLEDDFKDLLSRKGINPDTFSDIPYYEHPFAHRNWEIHNIGRHNWLECIRVNLVQLEVMYLSIYIKSNPSDANARSRLDAQKAQLKELAQTASLID